MKKLLTIPVLIILATIFVMGLNLSPESGKVTLTHDETKTISFNITNNDDVNYTNVALSYDQQNFVDTEGNNIIIEFSNNNFELINGSTEAITITVTPNNEQYIGSYTGPINIKVTKENDTEETKTYSLEVAVDSKFISVIVDNDNDLNELEPGDDFSIDFRIRNTWSEDLEDIVVRAWIIGLDDGSNVDARSTRYDIDRGDREDITLDFEIPLNVDEGRYDVEISVYGEDAETGEDFEIYQLYSRLVRVLKEEDEEVKFDRFDYPTETLQCGSIFTITVNAINTGQDRLDDMYLKFAIDGTNYYINSEKIDLRADRYRDREKKVDFLVTLPDYLDKTTYPIKVLAYNEDNDLVGGTYGNINLVSSCVVSDDEDENEQEEDNGEDSSTNDDQSNVIYLPTGFTTGTIFTSENLSLVFWGLGIIALLVVIIYFLVILFRKK